MQVDLLTVRVEQETQRRNLSQADLKAQRHEVSTLRSSEKQLKQELNHLLELRISMEKQNQELRRCVLVCVINLDMVCVSILIIT